MPSLIHLPAYFAHSEIGEANNFYILMHCKNKHMKHFLSFLFIGLCTGRLFCQDTTDILFIGNSFTYYNNMPQMVQSLASAAGATAYVGMHAPGGVSVGDIAQGNMAHMNNPALFSLIRSRKWDFVVIQDNQGRFVRDSAQFPSTSVSLVVDGHLRLMDSVKANNSCAKVILFGGWAFKNGSPPYGNTGIEMIRRILCNYRVLNDTMKEVISPIGEAWIKGINYLPAVNLWDPDDAHPSYAGSYLTASVIFSTIFNLPAKPLNYDGALAPGTAYTLRAFGDTSVFNPVFHVKYNLDGIKKIVPQESNGQISLPGTFAGYTWYKDGIFIGSTAVITATTDGNYSAIVQENDGCLVKTCVYSYSAGAVGLKELRPGAGENVYPNPVAGGGTLAIRHSLVAPIVELYTMAGVRQEVHVDQLEDETRLSTAGLTPGCYLLKLGAANGSWHKIMVLGE
jgi:hypothetical protein